MGLGEFENGVKVSLGNELADWRSRVRPEVGASGAGDCDILLEDWSSFVGPDLANGVGTDLAPVAEDDLAR